jgi:hypothetical protein
VSIFNIFAGRNHSATVPDAPVISSISAGSTSADVSYTFTGYNGGPPITSFTAVSSPGGLTGTVYQSTSGTITVTGLSADTTYTFTVYATNGIGNSSNSTSYEARTAGSVTFNAGLGTPIVGTTRSWTVPPGVSNISIVMVGAGGNAPAFVGGGGGGGALTYANGVPVTPGGSYNFYVGYASFSPSPATSKTWFNTPSYIFAGGGGLGSTTASPGDPGAYGGGGGAGGYAAAGGNAGGGVASGPAPNNIQASYPGGYGGSGGGTFPGVVSFPGGAGGQGVNTSSPTLGPLYATYRPTFNGGGAAAGGVQGYSGGGVGLNGQSDVDVNGIATSAGTPSTPTLLMPASYVQTANGGSGGGTGKSSFTQTTQIGGNYGGGAGAGNVYNAYGGSGAIRIIWGAGRSFPNNAT